MKNFLKVAEGMDVMPTLAALAMHPHLWNQNTLRTTHPGTAHAQADDIWLRFNEIVGDGASVIDDVACINYPAMRELPQARPLIFFLLARMEGEQLGRCLITRLKPGAVIAPHCDQGAPATFYDRFHIMLQCKPGVTFRAGDERVQMKSGEIWWFDNTVEHEVINHSDDDRISLIVDMRVTR